MVGRRLRKEDVLHSNGADGTPGPDHVECHVPGVCVADDFHNDIGAAAFRCLFDLRHRIIVQMQRYRAQRLRLLQSLRHRVDRIHRLDHRQSTSDGANANRSTSDADNCVFVTIPLGQILKEASGSEVARGEDVGHEHKHFLRNALGREHERRIRQRTTHVLSLPAVNRIRRRRVSKEFAFRAS